MAELGKVASLIRSKNAGPFTLTFDIMFADDADYRRVVSSGVLGPALVARLYALPTDAVRLYEHPAARAIKISIPRPFVQGQTADGDAMGGQQYAPLVKLEIP